ncbi:hypothetical protein EV702DRAFT_1041573 [Suillus placidus]|uniref:Uncharacterized protein n=1 Tax=Suillus placidus TaxID=48579 RepID=A0A9P7D678_9AGAM|nr:hypothetical protein EV702DRAFT_1041573 [Suillus placidus]
MGRATKTKGMDSPYRRGRDKRPNPHDKPKGQRPSQGGGMSKGKPPGIPSFGIHLAPSEEERMRKLTEVSEPLEGLFAGSVGLFMEEPFNMPSVDPEEDEPSVRFRDPVARRAEDHLLGIRFPGDGSKDKTHAAAWDDPDRFWVTKRDDDDTYESSSERVLSGTGSCCSSKRENALIKKPPWVLQSKIASSGG